MELEGSRPRSRAPWVVRSPVVLYCAHCLLVGLGLPVWLRLAGTAALPLLLGVAAAGALASVAATPRDRQLAWDQVVLVAAPWTVGWLWSGLVVWPDGLRLLATGYVGTFAQLYDRVGFFSLSTGPS